MGDTLPMYLPQHFAEDRPTVLAGLIEQHPLATIVRAGSTGLTADHIPLMFEATGEGAGQLVGHVARRNPLWQASDGQQLLVIFQGPSSYISPNWYATKHPSGKAVPTWNYAVVHAHCSLCDIHDRSQLLDLITRLTDRHESNRSQRWRVADAPQDYTENLLANIVGIRLTIHRWFGKWKVSQNQPAQNRQSVIDGLASEDNDAAAQMSSLVATHGGPKTK